MRNWMVEQGLEDAPEPVRKRKPKRRDRPEDHLQKCLIAYLRKRRRRVGDVRWIVAQPERFRTLWRQQHDKAMGMEAGHPELIIIQIRDGGRRVVFLEIKAVDGVMSDAQTEWQGWLLGNGFAHAVVRSVETLASILDA